MIVFLDFDGVLHPFHRETGTLVLLPHFEQVMRDFPDVDIVVSSAWRETHPLDVLRSFFSPDIAERIVDVTPVFAGFEHEYVRHAEILAWLREADREDEPWVAIDDIEDFFAPACTNLILVDTNIGFCDATELVLRERLSP